MGQDFTSWAEILRKSSGSQGWMVRQRPLKFAGQESEATLAILESKNGSGEPPGQQCQPPICSDRLWDRASGRQSGEFLYREQKESSGRLSEGLMTFVTESVKVRDEEWRGEWNRGQTTFCFENPFTLGYLSV